MNRLVFLVLLVCFSTINADDLRVDIIRNYPGYIKKNVIIWNDIPYAKPPIGKLRWKALEKYKKDSIIQSKDNNFCLQGHQI